MNFYQVAFLFDTKENEYDSNKWNKRNEGNKDRVAVISQ